MKTVKLVHIQNFISSSLEKKKHYDMNNPTYSISVNILWGKKKSFSIYFLTRGEQLAIYLKYRSLKIT